MRETLSADERLVVTVGDEATTRNRLRTAKTALVLTPPTDPNGAGEYLLDPNRPECVLARNAVETALLRKRVPDMPQPTEHTIEEPGGRYIDFLIPGLIGTNLMGGGLWGVGFVTVDMRVRKLLKRFLATPMRRSDFLLSLMLSRLVFTLIEIGILLGFAYLVFDIRVRGDIGAFLALLLLGGLAFAGVGLLVACRAKTIETVSGLMNAVMLPMYLFSGVFFSSDRFPTEIQPLIKLLPLTALNDGLRAVMNDGAGWASLPGPLAILVTWGAVSFVLALRFFRWR
jgi:ABC-type multidrug transport system permease subunit